MLALRINANVRKAAREAADKQGTVFTERWGVGGWGGVGT